jgi:hypothetical protein
VIQPQEGCDADGHPTQKQESLVGKKDSVEVTKAQDQNCAEKINTMAELGSSALDGRMLRKVLEHAGEDQKISILRLAEMLSKEQFAEFLLEEYELILEEQEEEEFWKRKYAPNNGGNAVGFEAVANKQSELMESQQAQLDDSKGSIQDKIMLAGGDLIGTKKKRENWVEEGASLPHQSDKHQDDKHDLMIRSWEVKFEECEHWELDANHVWRKWNGFEIF